MKHLYKFTFLLLIPFFSVAQSNYKPGYVVTLKGDTLHGFIDYHEWDRNPRDIHFKKGTGDANAENFSIKDAAAFAVNGQEYYERYILPVSQDLMDLAKLGPKTAVPYLTDTVFLKVINKGKYVALYRYVDAIKTRFYLKETDEVLPQELEYHAYYNAEESSVVKYDYRYRTQLQQATEKNNVSGGIIDQISSANYNETQLAKVVQVINGNSTSQFTAKELSGTRWFAGVGINYSSLKFVTNNNTPTSTKSTTNTSSIFPKIGAGIDVFINNNTRNLLFRLELSFTGSQYKITSSDQGGVPSTSTLDFKQYLGTLTPQIIYNFYNKEQLKLFVGVGAGFTLASYNHYQYVTKYETSSLDKTQDGYPDLEKFWVSTPVRLGVGINNRLEINVCYNPSVSILYNAQFSGNITSYQAGVNYFFGK